MAIASTCFIIAVVNRNVRFKASRFWMLFVVCVGLAATGGVVSHGFPTYLSPEQYFSVWWIKNDFILLGNLFAGLAIFSLTSFSPRKMTAILVFKLVLAASLLYVTFDFLPAVVDLALTYIAILIISWNRTEILGVKYLKQSFLIALISGVFYLFPFNLLNGWFTNKDAVHVFVIVSLILVSKAVRKVDSL